MKARARAKSRRGGGWGEWGEAGRGGAGGGGRGTGGGSREGKKRGAPGVVNQRLGWKEARGKCENRAAAAIRRLLRAKTKLDLLVRVKSPLD